MAKPRSQPDEPDTPLVSQAGDKVKPDAPWNLGRHLIRAINPDSYWFMAGTTGLEPATSAVTGQRSNQLSYVPKITHRRRFGSGFRPFGHQRETRTSNATTEISLSDSNKMLVLMAQDAKQMFRHRLTGSSSVLVDRPQ
jgi:hypothetical protein